MRCASASARFLKVTKGYDHVTYHIPPPSDRACVIRFLAWALDYASNDNPDACVVTLQVSPFAAIEQASLGYAYDATSQMPRLSSLAIVGGLKSMQGSCSNYDPVSHVADSEQCMSHWIC